MNLSGLKQLRKLPNTTIMLSYQIEDGSNKTNSTLIFFPSPYVKIGGQFSGK